MIDTAAALQHAHDLGVLHRNVKPSNLMVDEAGHCWIIDFGLATYLNGTKPNGAGAAVSASAAEPLTRQGLAGTPEYMAPEQWRGERVDPRTDVWGLGATLYELLTLRRAFAGAAVDEVRERVLNAEPESPEMQVRGLPADLAAIVRKALAKDPARRYASARAFAADLRRWLDGEPTEARPAWVLRRVILWARRSKGWAVLLGGLVLACAGLAVAGWALENSGRAVAEAEQREQQRQKMLVELQLLRLRKREVGWSDKAWKLAAEVAAMRADASLRNQAAAVLIGIDAVPVKTFHRDGTAMAFDAAGQRLLIGGADPGQGRPSAAAASLWEPGPQVLTSSLHAGPGPVAFGAGGAPLHLAVSSKDPHVLELWDVARQQRVREFRVPGGNGPLSKLELALTPDAGLLAASAQMPDGKSVLTVWDAATGKLLRHDLDIDEEITGLGVHPTAGFVATGSAQGRIALYPLQGDKPVPLPAAAHAPITCFDFCQAAGPRKGANAEGPWLLAAGEKGGRLTIWDLRRRLPMTFCHGSDLELFTVRFSPDGTILASGGRYAVKLWDVATGRFLLDLHDDFPKGIAFTPDGNQLATSSVSVFGPVGRAMVLQLEYARGIRTYRGLVGPVNHALLSPKGKYLAALSDDWQVAVWEQASGRLVHLWNGPRGLTSDNAALAFSRDESRLAVATTWAARAWDLATGQVSKDRPLPPGLQDALAWSEDGQHLFSCRLETADGVAPFGIRDRQAHPLVCRFRDLLAVDPTKMVLASLSEFNRRVHDIHVGSAGGPFGIIGDIEEAGRIERRITFLDRTSGRKLDSWPTEGIGRVVTDPAGEFLVTGAGRLAAIPTGKPVAAWNAPGTQVLGPGARIGTGRTDSAGMTLSRRGDAAPFAILGLDNEYGSGAFPEFSEDGRYLVWGNTDGTVLVADLPEVQRRLARIGLGW